MCWLGVFTLVGVDLICLGVLFYCFEFGWLLLVYFGFGYWFVYLVGLFVSGLVFSGLVFNFDFCVLVDSALVDCFAWVWVGFLCLLLRCMLV